MMEDKTFALLEKLHIELLDTKKQMNDAKEESNQRLDRLEGQLTVMEQGHGMKLDAALDGCRLVFEKLQEHDLRFVSLEDKLQTQELEVRVTKGSKSIAG
jgi:hypothetical protein